MFLGADGHFRIQFSFENRLHKRSFLLFRLKNEAAGYTHTMV